MIKTQETQINNIGISICVLMFCLFNGCSSVDKNKVSETAPTNDIEINSMPNNLVDIYKKIKKGRQAGSSSSRKQERLLLNEWTTRLNKNKSTEYDMCDEVDLVAHTYRKSSKTKGRYDLEMLFRVKQDFDKDYLLNVLIYPNKSHVVFLPESNRKGGYGGWGFLPRPESTSWKEESISISDQSYYLVNRSIKASDIPYRIKLFFYSNDQNGKYAGSHGNRIDLGWQLDLSN